MLMELCNGRWRRRATNFRHILRSWHSWWRGNTWGRRHIGWWCTYLLGCSRSCVLLRNWWLRSVHSLRSNSLLLVIIWLLSLLHYCGSLSEVQLSLGIRVHNSGQIQLRLNMLVRHSSPAHCFSLFNYFLLDPRLHYHFKGDQSSVFIWHSKILLSHPLSSAIGATISLISFRNLLIQLKILFFYDSPYLLLFLTAFLIISFFLLTLCCWGNIDFLDGLVSHSLVEVLIPSWGCSYFPLHHRFIQILLTLILQLSLLHLQLPLFLFLQILIVLGNVVSIAEAIKFFEAESWRLLSLRSVTYTISILLVSHARIILLAI